MAYNEQLADRIREALMDVPGIEEKKMFRGISFLVQGKMCVNVSKDEMMCRIDPALHDMALEKRGCSTVIMKGKEYKGWILISEEGMRTQKQFEYWISLALAFNEHAKAAPKRKKKKT